MYISDKENCIKEEEVAVISTSDESYPERLKSIYDPPEVLYLRGTIKNEDFNAVAIVGARKCSSYGLKMAAKIATGLASKGVTVVSGMARGVDICAHTAAIEAGGRTIAVMGSGFGHIYPPEAESLIHRIIASGAIMTEYPYSMSPLRWNFPKRNRIISGMSMGVVVVEAAAKSGALITADFALDENREVFAVPGRADFNTSKGTNALIQAGAKLITCADDVLEELNIRSKTHAR